MMNMGEIGKSPFPPLFEMGLKLNCAKNLLLRSVSREEKLAQFLRGLTFHDSIMLQIDFSFMYYAITNQIKLKTSLMETISIAKGHTGFKSQDPDAFEIFNQGLMFLSKSKIKDALKCVEKAIEITPNNPMYWMELSRIYSEIGKIKKAKDVREEFLEIMEEEKRLKNREKKFNEILKLLESKKDYIENIPHKKLYNKIIKADDGLIDFLIAATKEVSNYLKGDPSNIPEDKLVDTLVDCLECLEWCSNLSNLVFFKLEYDYGNNEQLNILKDSLVKVLGWTPENLPEKQTPNFVSPEKRKKAWEVILGMDIISGKMFDSIKDATYIRIDGNENNDDPKNHVWVLKESIESRERESKIIEEHRAHPESNLVKIAKHIDKVFGKVENVVHQEGSRLVHIDIHVVQLAKERNNILLISSGMSELPMHSPPDIWKWWGIDINDIPPERRGAFNCDHAELVIKLPPKWSFPKEEGQIKDTKDVWPIIDLVRVINYIHEEKQWLWDGHTLDSQIMMENTNFAGWLCIYPPILPKVFGMLKINPSRVICFLQLIPLYSEEITFAIRNGHRALLNLFEKFNTPDYIDIKRRNVCR